MPRVELPAISQRAGNSRIFMRPLVPGAQWANGSMSNAVGWGPFQWEGRAQMRLHAPMLGTPWKTVTYERGGGHATQSRKDQPNLRSSCSQ
jgi:hypothetical protein